MATYNTVPLKETAADDKPLLERKVNVSVKKILGAAVLVSFVIGPLAAVAIEPQSVALTPMAFSEKRQYTKCGVSCTHDLECGSCGNDCVATRAEINRSSITPVSTIRLFTTAQGQGQAPHDVQAPGRRQVQELLQVLLEQRALQRQLRPLHVRGVMSRGAFPSRSASFIGCITGHKGKGDEYHRCKPHSETNED